MNAIRLIWPWARPYLHYAVAGSIASVFGVLINLSIPLLTSRIIDEGIAAEDSATVLRTALLMLGLIIVGMASSAVVSLLGVRFAFHTITDLRRDLYSHVQHLSFGNLDRLTSGEILNTVLQENIQGAEVIKAFVRQDHEVDRFDVAATDLADEATLVNQLVAALFPSLIFLSSMGIAAVLWIGGGNVIDGNLSQGDLVAFIQFMAFIAMPMMFFAFLQPLLSAAGASMKRIAEVTNETADVVVADNGKELPTTQGPLDIEFDDVSFHYRADAEMGDCVLRGINVRIPGGTTVAILGATGSGKSTMVNLIPRFYDASHGTVRVGGIDVRELNKSSLRRQRHGCRQPPVRAARCDERRHHRRCHRCAGTRFRCGDGRRLRSGHRAGRGQPVRRPTPAPRHCPHLGRRPQGPDLR